MPLIKRAKDVYLFPTGMLAVCGEDGQQIPELQGPYSIVLHRRIMLEALDECIFIGFEILPFEFCQVVRNWLKHWHDKNLSWDEIHAL